MEKITQETQNQAKLWVEQPVGGAPSLFQPHTDK